MGLTGVVGIAANAAGVEVLLEATEAAWPLGEVEQPYYFLFFPPKSMRRKTCMVGGLHLKFQIFWKDRDVNIHFSGRTR